MTFVEMNPPTCRWPCCWRPIPPRRASPPTCPGPGALPPWRTTRSWGLRGGPGGEQTAEIFNIAVAPNRQQQGIGSGLLRFVLENLAGKGIGRVELGTGSFGHQLTYYQRHGFRVHAVVKDHFLIHYPEPLMEHGIQHKDMLRLSLALAPDTASPDPRGKPRPPLTAAPVVHSAIPCFWYACDEISPSPSLPLRPP